MRPSYDPRRNVAYLRLRDATSEVETVLVSDEINIDLAADGTVACVELLNANEQLRWDGGRFVVAHEGDRREGVVTLDAA